MNGREDGIYEGIRRPTQILGTYFQVQVLGNVRVGFSSGIWTRSRHGVLRTAFPPSLSYLVRVDPKCSWGETEASSAITVFAVSELSESPRGERRSYGKARVKVVRD